MVMEFVYRQTLEKRLNDLLAPQRHDLRLRIVSLHILDPIIRDQSFLDKLEKLSRRQAKVAIVADRRQTQKDPIKLKIKDDIENIGKIRFHLRQNIHAKIVHMESHNEYGVLVSSANISDHALHTYREGGIFLLNEQKEIHEKIGEYISHILGNDRVGDADFESNDEED